MSERDGQATAMNAFTIASCSVGLGVWWAVWDVYGFWWGLLYGLFWHEWVGYRLATFLVS